MNQTFAFPLLVCSLLGASACSSSLEPASAGASGGASGSGGGPAAGGSSGGTGANITPAGGSSASAGSAGSAGQSAGGMSAGGASQGGQASGGAGGATAGAGGTLNLPPLEECMNQASVDRLTSWTASGEGTTVPTTGSILVKEGADYVGKVQLVGAGWHVIPVLVANKFDVSADLSSSTGITLTYSATAELHVQLRSKSHWSGGDQYATTIPSTNGKTETHFFSFAQANWMSLFGTPALSYADTLKEAMGLVFVGDGENTVVFSGLRIDGYTPPCP